MRNFINLYSLKFSHFLNTRIDYVIEADIKIIFALGSNPPSTKKTTFFISRVIAIARYEVNKMYIHLSIIIRLYHPSIIICCPYHLSIIIRPYHPSILICLYHPSISSVYPHLSICVI